MCKLIEVRGYIQGETRIAAAPKVNSSKDFFFPSPRSFFSATRKILGLLYESFPVVVFFVLAILHLRLLRNMGALSLACSNKSSGKRVVPSATP
jgi:hypothetical protein